MTDEHVFDLLPEYALGILDEEDLLRAAGHLSQCATCQRELAGYTETADRLVYAAPPQSPAPDLKARVLQRVERASALHAQPEPPAARKAGLWETVRSWFGGGNAGRLAFGALALLALVLAANNLLLWRRVNDLQARLPSPGVHLVEMVGTENAPGALGYVMVFEGNHYGSLTVENAPALDPEYQYQVWLIKDGQRSSGGVFSVNDWGYAVLQIRADEPLDTFDSFGITIEPAGGSPGPTGAKILGGDL